VFGKDHGKGSVLDIDSAEKPPPHFSAGALVAD
jgi:hypothetical protein